MPVGGQRVNIAEIKTLLAPRMEEICRRLLPNGTREGNGWRVGNIAGDRGQSLEVELQGPRAGLWLDRAGSDQGDAIDLIAQACRITKPEALRWAHEFLGITPLPPKAAANPNPVDPLTFKHPRRPEPATAAWPYHDANDRVIAYAVRFDLPPKPGETKPGKDVIPFRWIDGKWHSKGWLKDGPERSPLYNLHHLTSRPSFPVLLVEGEKTAEAALRIFPTRIVTTWQGGSKSFTKADLEPLQGRDVVFWPDADEPGLDVVDAVLAALPQARVVELPPGLPEGWDLADPVPEGIDVVAIEAAARKAAPMPPRAPMLSVGSAAQKPQPTGETIPTATVASESIFFSGASRSWWVRTSTGCFVEMDKPLVAKELIRLGLSPKVKDDGLSEIDQFLLRANKEPVCYSGPLAGHKAGPIDHPNGRILVTQPCQPLRGVDAPCSHILEWLHQLTGRDEQQFYTLLIWMHFRRRALLTNTWRPGQMLVLAGPRGCGKSFVQSRIITPLLGGRTSRPYRYMAGGTEFNAELFATEHLCIEDESPARDLHSRRTLGSHIKSMLFSAVQSCHPKGRTAIPLTPIWAMSLSVNEEPENLMVLPPIDDALADKLIILKCQKPNPPAGHSEEMRALLMMADRELPAFANYLDTLTIPPDYAEPRTGLRHYHNPEIAEALQGLSPEAKLDQLVTAALFQDSNEWEGKALELEIALTRWDSSGRHEAQKLFSYNSACGVYLARLVKSMPDRYRKRVVHGCTLWGISAPKFQPDPTDLE
jgi:hypothetical protein